MTRNDPATEFTDAEPGNYTMIREGDPGPLADPLAVPGEGTLPGSATPGTELATITPAQIEALIAPHAMRYVDVAAALLNNARYEEEPDAGGASSIVASILTATSSDAALKAAQMDNAESLIGTDPGTRSDRMIIRKGLALESAFDEGVPCFMVISAVWKATGEPFQFTSGARAVQATVLKHTFEGWLPFECVLTRRRKATRKGFFPLNLEFAG